MTPITDAAVCWCAKCRPITLRDMRMILCPVCGNKRCPRASNHEYACTASNEPGQPGSNTGAGMTDKPSRTQVGGCHYVDMAVQPWDALECWLTAEQFQAYLLGTAIAYLARVGAQAEGKGGRQDVEKAAHVLAKLLEVMK